MTIISNIKGREIIDSRGNPTLEVDVLLENDVIGRASVPSGASTGAYEVIEKRDNDHRYLGKGVKKAVEIINNEICNVLKGKNCSDQEEIDNILINLDGSINKINLGGNSILGVSLACSRAAANSKNIPLYFHIGGESSVTLPIPFMNIINGGAHANNSLDFQELMVVPFGFDSFSESLRCGAEIFQSLKTILLEQNFSIAVGDEGGFAPNFSSHKEALDYIIIAIEKAGYTPGKNVSIALDVASTEFFNNNEYILNGENKRFDSQGLIDYLHSLTKEYPIISIEDALAEDDWEGWKIITKQMGENIQLVGDDLFVTNTSRLDKGIKENIANSILIKFNQIGTLTETLNAINMAKKASYTSMISHRSGETEDTFIADLSVATNAGQIKTGSLSRSDRLSKYNQLLRIEELLGDKALFNKDKYFYS
ncbi:MAG: Enolase [Alphaproteobacteria bacterium MarineAlpha9_Bin3]|nr:MAG: Enolase [Alphaproteobacteria bacterium MarineAlpha9_Bin3]|tara:strand:+ start:37065 stop:38339 length:1275 start_codon:yes stop_codon:yes gene_type:complete